MAGPLSDRELWKRVAGELVKPVLAALDSSRNRDDVSLILRQFLDQVLNSACVISHLAQSYDAEWGAEGAVILRRAYDISFQTMYLVEDPTDALERAKDYEDYKWIDKNRSIRDMDESASEGLALAIATAESPKRDLAEADFKAKFDRAIDRQRGRHGKKRRNWYGQDLSVLACQAELLHEYRFIVRDLHAITHNAPSVQYGSVMSNQNRLLLWMVVVARRVMKCNLDYQGISLGAELDDCFTDAFEDIHVRYG